MSDAPKTNPAELSPAELQSAMFAQLVMQQANMGYMLLGKVPHPETGKSTRDLQAAQMFIGQLEMLEAKTKGNLSREEQKLLQQTLMSLRMTFVEVASAPPASEPGAPADNKTAPAEPADAAKSEDSGKRFSKTYPT
jgi:hypothetical protein